LIDLQVEDAGTCRKRLKIRVPHDDIRAKLDESYETLRESANVPGFRKGHVPRRLLERRFGEQVVEELKQNLMAEASSEALEKAELKALGEPSFESAEFNVDEDFTFEVTVEVEPEFDLGEYKGLQLTRRPVEVSEEEVEAEVRNLLRRLGTYEPVRDAPVAMGDVLTCDWEIVVGEETVLNVPNDRITVAEGLFRDVAAEDVAGRLVGARQGDTVEVKVRIPEEHPVERLRGKEGALRLTLRKVLRPSIPELTQEVAERLDFDSPEEVRQEVRDRLRLRKVQQQREDLERQAEEALLAACDFDLPEGLLKRQSQRNLDRQQMRLRMRGFSDEEIQKRMDELRAASETAAERNFRLYFILNRIADREKIFVTDNEVENAVARLAAAYRVSQHKMRQDLEANDRLSDLRQEMRIGKVMDFLIQNADIQE